MVLVILGGLFALLLLVDHFVLRKDSRPPHDPSDLESPQGLGMDYEYERFRWRMLNRGWGRGGG